MAKRKKRTKEETRKRAAEITAQRMQQDRNKKEKGSFIDYLKSVRFEMKKVVWPTSKELRSYTVVVLVTCVFFAVAFWAIDTGFLAILRRLIGLKL